MSRGGALAVALCACAALLGTPVRGAATAPTGTPLKRGVATRFVRGADLSSLPEVEAAGGRFRDGAATADPLAILRANGFNGARLRLWHSPAGGVCGLAATLAMAKRLRAAGLPVLLDLHYSDTWADPGHQAKPAAWERADFAILRDSVRTYTRDVIAAFREAGVMPECVQPGNEIGNGLLWPDGRITRGSAQAASYRMAATLVTEAARGAREGAGGQALRLMLHYENGGDPRGAAEFFDAMAVAGAAFDCLGLSYYPWWHGPLDSLAANVARLRERFHREVAIVECGYPFALQGWDGAHNVVGLPSQQVAGFPATPAGQRAFMRTLLSRARRAGAGSVYYWEPAWVSAPRRGSAWENVALFDSSGAALPALRAFGRGR